MQAEIETERLEGGGETVMDLFHIYISTTKLK